MTGAATFNGNSLNTFSVGNRTGISVSDIDHTSIPEKSLPIYSLADTDGHATGTPRYPSKPIKIEGIIAGISGDDLDARIDAFKGQFRGENKNLDIVYNGTSRRYKASVVGLPIIHKQKGMFARYTLQFLCQPFSTDLLPTTLFSQANYTSSLLAVTPTVIGNAPIQLPVFTITLTALTGTGDYVQVSNEMNGQKTLIYNQSLVSGAVIVIDSAQKITTLNETQIDPYGSYIELPPGASSLTYTDGFATRTAQISATYYPQYF